MSNFWKKESNSAIHEEFNNFNGSSSLVKPQLSRDSCISSSTIRSFLTKSRLYTDDTLKEKLNNNISKNDRLNSQTCSMVLNTILSPAWNDRLEIIHFCSNESKLMRKEIEDLDNNKDFINQPEFNPRINPYAEEDFENMKNEKFKSLDSFEIWIKNETKVEKIIEGRSLSLLSDNCPVKLVEAWKLARIN